MIKEVTHAHLGLIWYHSEPSDIPYPPNQFLGWTIIHTFLQQTGSTRHKAIPFTMTKVEIEKYIHLQM